MALVLIEVPQNDSYAAGGVAGRRQHLRQGNLPVGRTTEGGGYRRMPQSMRPDRLRPAKTSPGQGWVSTRSISPRPPALAGPGEASTMDLGLQGRPKRSRAAGAPLSRLPGVSPARRGARLARLATFSRVRGATVARCASPPPPGARSRPWKSRNRAPGRGLSPVATLRGARQVPGSN
jgi:hypothetical protein